MRFRGCSGSAGKSRGAEPYINNLLEVAHLVSTALSKPDTNLIIAALLHDVIEDAGVTKTDMAQRFGSDVADLVAEVTDDKTLPKAERKRLQIVNAPEEIRAGADDQAGRQDIQPAGDPD